MSMGYRGKTTNAGREGVAVQSQGERESMIGEMSGTVVSFDPSNQTISVIPDYRPVHDGEEIQMPELQEVPVRFPRIGGFVITSPVKEGDKVTLRPQMRSSENYHTEGEYNTPSDTRSFSLSDMEAFLDGGEPLTNPIQNFNPDNFELRTESGSFKLEMSEDGSFKMDGSQGNWIDLLARLAEIVAQHEVIVTKGSSAGKYSHDLAGEAKTIAGKLRGMQI